MTARSSKATANTKLRVLVVSKKSTYARYVEDERDARFEQLLREGHASVARIEAAHQEHEAALDAARAALAHLGGQVTYQVVGSEVPSAADLVVTLGGDGTLLWVSHIVPAGVPMVAINTAPSDSVGYFCAGTRDTLGDCLSDALKGALKATVLTRMQVSLDGQFLSRRVLNDMLFSHRVPAATTRCVLEFRGEAEDQKSSGVWVGPAAGSTAAIRSAGGDVLPFESADLQFVVREPYVGDGRTIRIRSGRVTPGESIGLLSKTPTASVYLDGPYREHAVPMGARLEMTQSTEPLTLLGLPPRRLP